MKIYRPAASSLTLALSSAAFIVLIHNHSFWSSFLKTINVATFKGFLLTVSVFVVHTGVLTVVFLVFGGRRLLKPLIIIFILFASVISYFETQFGVIIDKGMIQNIIQTDRREADELITASLFLHLLFGGLLPGAAVGFVRVQYGQFLREISFRAAAAAGIVIITGALFYIDYKDFAFIGREHKEIRMLANPLGPFYSAYKYASRRDHPSAVTPIGLDAVQDPPPGPGKKTVVVMVVGETAREKEFSLNGYARRTDPYLEKDQVISFSQAYSCGTATAESLPCMFSHLEPSRYSVDSAAHYENVLDVLSRAKVSVFWRENNSGCKGVCSRIPTELLSTAAIPGLCENGECYDEVLLDHLQEHLDHADSDMLVVLHQKGSHGPAYFRRHPKRFTVFTPECISSSPQDCGAEELVNAYDNTILYTDYFLDRTIAFLRRNASKTNALLIYFSDHGESLGENGIFLHGLPKIIAPDVQKHVPFIIWMSNGYARRHRVDRACLSLHRALPYSHANLFHTLLGAFDIKTEVYHPALDVLASCRS